jgi:hypothetical protein
MAFNGDKIVDLELCMFDAVLLGCIAIKKSRENICPASYDVSIPGDFVSAEPSPFSSAYRFGKYRVAFIFNTLIVHVAFLIAEQAGSCNASGKTQGCMLQRSPSPAAQMRMRIKDCRRRQAGSGSNQTGCPPSGKTCQC